MKVAWPADGGLAPTRALVLADFATTPMSTTVEIAIEFAAYAAVLHGTGSITEEFQRITAGKTGASGTPTVNPHNQTFAVAIQLGLVAVLWAMWIAHIALFTGRSAPAWLGLVVVDVLSSTVHSHLFDFNSGWLYVFGVGVLGGTILGERGSVSEKTEFGG